MFSNPKFILSATRKAHFPSLKDRSGKPLKEIAFAGRSNVGKSSLINHLTRRRNLAKVSSTPGKTQQINFFTFDNQLALIDLPGYGFAKVSKELRSDWGKLTEDYLAKRKELHLVLHLIDSRHLPTEQDFLFAKWAEHFEIPTLFVFTKTDKLSQSALQKQIDTNLSLLIEKVDLPPISPITYSIKGGKGREHLIKKIEEHIQWG